MRAIQHLRKRGVAGRCGAEVAIEGAALRRGGQGRFFFFIILDGRTYFLGMQRTTALVQQIHHLLSVARVHMSARIDILLAGRDEIVKSRLGSDTGRD